MKNQQPVKLPEEQPTMRLTAMPRDTNTAGDVFGGWIMSQVDLAGSIAANRRANGRVVTVAVNSFQFHMPVYIGDLISCYAKVTKVGTTSLSVFVEVFAERYPNRTECVKVTEATLTYVAVGNNGKPRPVDQK